jgi:hypothetical protein
MENEQEAKKETLAENGSKQASVLIRARLRTHSTRLQAI